MDSKPGAEGEPVMLHGPERFLPLHDQHQHIILNPQECAILASTHVVTSTSAENCCSPRAIFHMNAVNTNKIPDVAAVNTDGL